MNFISSSTTIYETVYEAPPKQNPNSPAHKDQNRDNKTYKNQQLWKTTTLNKGKRKRTRKYSTACNKSGVEDHKKQGDKQEENESNALKTR